MASSKSFRSGTIVKPTFFDSITRLALAKWTTVEMASTTPQKRWIQRVRSMPPKRSTSAWAQPAWKNFWGSPVRQSRPNTAMVTKCSTRCWRLKRVTYALARTFMGGAPDLAVDDHAPQVKRDLEDEPAHHERDHEAVEELHQPDQRGLLQARLVVREPGPGEGGGGAGVAL